MHHRPYMGWTPRACVETVEIRESPNTPRPDGEATNSAGLDHLTTLMSHFPITRPEHDDTRVQYHNSNVTINSSELAENAEFE